MIKCYEMLVLTIKGYRLKEEHEAHQKREAVSPFEKEKVKSFLVETVLGEEDEMMKSLSNYPMDWQGWRFW